MKSITLKKVSKAHLQALQKMLQDYSEGFREHLANTTETNDYMYSVSQVTIVSGMWYSCRNKLETGKKSYSLQLKAFEAVVLFIACGNSQILSLDPYVVHVATTYRNILDQELKSYFSPEQVAIMQFN